MNKEKFRRDVKELLVKSFERMSKNVDSFCDSDCKGFDSYIADIQEMDFMQALLSLEARNHSSLGCCPSVQRESKQRVEDYKLSIICNR